MKMLIDVNTNIYNSNVSTNITMHPKIKNFIITQKLIVSRVVDHLVENPRHLRNKMQIALVFAFIKIVQAVDNKVKNSDILLGEEKMVQLFELFEDQEAKFDLMNSIYQSRNLKKVHIERMERSLISHLQNPKYKVNLDVLARILNCVLLNNIDSPEFQAALTKKTYELITSKNFDFYKNFSELITIQAAVFVFREDENTIKRILELQVEMIEHCLKVKVDPSAISNFVLMLRSMHISSNLFSRSQNPEILGFCNHLKSKLEELEAFQAKNGDAQSIENTTYFNSNL